MQKKSLREITLAGVLLGVLITIIFTTANVYLGLKVGLTFASSIPAAVFSMAFFKMFRKNNILENNIVQTQVSAAGTLSAVVFIIPALFFVGYWSGFDFWHTFIICAGGGILGVIFTIPSRIELVEKNQLPYPEGIAAAEVLQLGEKKKEQDMGAKEMLLGAGLAGVSTFLSQGMKIITDGVEYFFNIGKAIFQLPFGFSLALIGAGWLVGIGVGVAILVGVLIAWCVLVPIASSLNPMSGDIGEVAMEIWKNQVRFIGVGMIGIAAIWTFLQMLKPTIKGLSHSFKFSTSDQKDIPAKWLLLCFLAVVALLIIVFYDFVSVASFSPLITWSFVLVASLCAVIIGFLISATCGYMAGLVGSSSSPISGIGILGVVLLSLCVLGVAKIFSLELDEGNKQFFIALSLFATSIVFAVATIANDNLQDLKTGMLVGATPWKQEVILMLGCIVGASVIAPVLNLLYEAYGFVGHLPREGMKESNALNAPQAILMAAIAEGIFKNTLNWLHIGIGAVIGAGVIIIDILLKRKNLLLPPLAVGMGVYLPPIVTIPIFFGAMLAYMAQKQITTRAIIKGSNVKEAQETFKRRGTLLASGLIVGESLTGILIAGAIVVSVSSGGSEDVFMPSFVENLPSFVSQALGFAFFGLSLAIIFYYLTKSKKNARN